MSEHKSKSPESKKDVDIVKPKDSEVEDGELTTDDSRKSSKRKRDSKPRRSRSRNGKDHRRSKERRDDKRSSKRNSRDRDRDKDRNREQDNRRNDRSNGKSHTHSQSHRRDSKERRRDRSREASRKRPRSSERRPEKKEVKVEAVPITAEQKTEEEEYKKRVEQQLEQLTEEQNSDREAELRRKRREELLSKFKKDEQKVVKKESLNGTHDNPNGNTDVVDVKPKVEVDKKSYDMFSDSPSKLVVPLQGKVANPNVTDGFDDSEGYYVFRLGDILDSRYRVVASQGRGVFSTVLRVTDTAFANRELVVKVIRNNETMLKAGLKELDFLKDLSKKDPEGKKHCVKLISSFEHRNHLCLVFEPMHMNLREVLRKFGGVGLNINAVRTYAKQLLIALKHLKDCGILHGDLKPDNILVNEHMNQVKLCDFGSAGRISECEITPYLVSRFYRAPEIMLGLKYGDLADIWSLGCVLYELYTGKILFSGKDNNEMLKLMMEVKGAFSKKCLRKGEFHSKHFDEDFLFQQKRIDSLTGQELTEKVAIMKPQIDLIALLAQANTQAPLSEKDRKKVTQLGDLLLKIFELDPTKRISVVDCLKHPFIKDD